MARGRGLLTEYEREALAGEHGEQRRYEARSRFRARVEEELRAEVALLAAEGPDLLAELRTVVCEVPQDGESTENRDDQSSP